MFFDSDIAVSFAIILRVDIEYEMLSSQWGTFHR